jgi:hypothetical protein
MAKIHSLVTMGILILAVSAVVTALPARASEVGRYEAIQLDATSIFVLDTREGHCWVVNATPSAPSMIYTGQVRPAKKMGETIKPPKEKKD